MDAKRERDIPDAKASGASNSSGAGVGSSSDHRAERKCQDKYSTYTDTDESTGARTLEDNEVNEEECKGSDMNIIQLAIDYCQSSAFQSALESFKRGHASAFEVLAESKNPEREEQTLEHMAVFNAHRYVSTCLHTYAMGAYSVSIHTRKG